METVTDEYVFFAIACLVIAVVMMRLLLRERITLQGSMSYLAFLTLLGLMAVFPHLTGRVAHALGFQVMSNFLFCTAIAALAVLHLRTLVTLSKVQLRSITLTQELAILQERLDRALSVDESDKTSSARRLARDTR